MICLGSPCVALVSKSSAPNTLPGFQGPMGNDMPHPRQMGETGMYMLVRAPLLLPEWLLHCAPSAVLSPHLTPIGCLDPWTS